MQQTTPQVVSLKVSFETGKEQWLLTLSPTQEHLRQKEIPAGDLAAYQKEVEKALGHFKLPPRTPVVCCYEAGRDGFWIARAVGALGHTVLVVDSSSIEVPQRGKRPKTDPIDGRKLLKLLVRHCAGEPDVFAVVQPPTELEEDLRRPHRELQSLNTERIQHRNRIESLLQLQGARLKIRPACPADLERVRTWKHSPLGAEQQAELKREYRRLQLVLEQIQEIEGEQKRRLKVVREEAAAQRAQAKQARAPGETQTPRNARPKKKAPEAAQRAPFSAEEREFLQKVNHLVELRGIGMKSAWKLIFEFFGWRRFKNRRQVGGLAGLTGTPYNSGTKRRDQGISRAGNARIRTLMVELGWSWLRNQPASKISQWFVRHVGDGQHSKTNAIVAVARKLLVALWHYVDFGEIPAGALLKTEHQAQVQAQRLAAQAQAAAAPAAST